MELNKLAAHHPDPPISDALRSILDGLDASNVGRRIESWYTLLPIPQDFRIIGTLNSFDRNYLNRISEAMKRRFSFIEISPPSREYRLAEQAIVLRKALQHIAHLSNAITADAEIHLTGILRITTPTQGLHTLDWEADSGFQTVFEQVWNLFEVIRIYRPLGTAQAISFVKQALIEGLLSSYTSVEQWSSAFDHAVCMTIADQVQVLLPDELRVILQYVQMAHSLPQWSDTFNQRLNELNVRRQIAQLNVLHATHRHEVAYQNHPTELIAFNDDYLTHVFHLSVAAPSLPLFVDRLAYYTEHGA